MSFTNLAVAPVRRRTRSALAALVLLSLIAPRAAVADKQFLADRPVDLIHVRLELDVDLVNEKVDAVATIDVKALRDVRSITGYGNFTIFDGQLWITPMFKELEKLSFVTIEGIGELEFNQANGSFTIEDQSIYSEDLVLSSRLIDIHVRGKIGFDRSLDLKVISRFSSGLINESYDLGGLAPTVINMAEKKITQYRITGALQDPVYQPVT